MKISEYSSDPDLIPLELRIDELAKEEVKISETIRIMSKKYSNKETVESYLMIQKVVNDLNRCQLEGFKIHTEIIRKFSKDAAYQLDNEIIHVEQFLDKISTFVPKIPTVGTKEILEEFNDMLSWANLISNDLYEKISLCRKSIVGIIIQKGVNI